MLQACTTSTAQYDGGFCDGYIVALEWTRAGEHLEQHHTKGPDVAALVRRFSLGLLWRHVSRRAEDHTGRRHRWGGDGRGLGQLRRRTHRPSWLRHLGQAEVQYFHRAVVSDLDVRRLQVAVHDPVLVRGLERVGDLAGDGQRFVDRERTAGNAIGKYFIERARDELLRRELGYHMPDRDLAFFMEGEPLFDDYVEAVGWAQDYARANREVMMERTLRALRDNLPKFKTDKTAVNCHHNYVAVEEHFGEKVFVTRKGAINAEAERFGIIPGSMGAKSFIIKGLGNPESFNSCSHGAGRKMSRTKAKAKYTIDDLKNQTIGVECRKDKGVVDEIPGAYKDIEEVMRAQQDLVEIVAELKQVICVKG